MESLVTRRDILALLVSQTSGGTVYSEPRNWQVRIFSADDGRGSRDKTVWNDADLLRNFAIHFAWASRNASQAMGRGFFGRFFVLMQGQKSGRSGCGSRSKQKGNTRLHIAAGVQLRCDVAERGRCGREIGCAELMPVEDVEGIEARLDDEPVAHVEVLEQREIRVLGGIFAERVLGERAVVVCARLICRSACCVEA